MTSSPKVQDGATTSAELMIENIGILSRRHLVVFVTIRDPELEATVDQAPDDLDGVVTRFGMQGMDQRKNHFYKMRVKPWLWLARMKGRPLL